MLNGTIHVQTHVSFLLGLFVTCLYVEDLVNVACFNVIIFLYQKGNKIL